MALGEESVAQSFIKKSGFFLQEHYTGAMQGKEVQYENTFGYNIGTKHFQLSRADFYHGNLNLFEGNWELDHLDLKCPMILAGSRTLTLRLIYSKLSDTSFEIESQRSTDGQTWDTFNTVKYYKEK